jgi:diguanylate cyclase (GGDEF)-like protein
MLLLYGSRNGREYEPQFFPVFDLTPSLHDIRKNPSCLVFCPLYYRSRSFGYVAMDLGKGIGSALYPVLMLLNGTLMSLYLQMNIKRSASTIERMANHDIMTGLLNRRGYMQLAPAMLRQAREEGKVFVLLSGDMDHMKDINDRFGHLAGDEAICRMGRALQIVSRQGMIPVHISGDEFIAYGLADSERAAEEIIPLVNSELKRINEEDPWLCDISASLGVCATVPAEGDSIDSFMTRADRAMYEDKNRNKYGRRKEDFAEHLAENKSPEP